MTGITAFYRPEGELAEDDSVMTCGALSMVKAKRWCWRRLMSWPDTVRLMPVLRLRDARFMRRIHNGTVPHSPQIEITARQLDFLSRELVSHPQNLSDGQIRQGLSAMVQLLEHYFAEQSSAQTRHRLMRRRSHDEQRSWRYLDIINRMIDARRAQPSGDPAGAVCHPPAGERDGAPRSRRATAAVD